jgi:hypothetical protein
MKPQTALDKIAELGQQLMLDSNPETARLGVALMTLPVSASEDYDDLQELTHLIFTFARVKMEQKKAIQNLLRP